MPTVAVVDGVRIIFYWNDHLPPHFHVEIAQHTAQISLETLDVTNGSLPPAKWSAVRNWAMDRRKELQECWD